MSNDLAIPGTNGNLPVVPATKYPALVPDSEIREAMLANSGGEPMEIGDLTRVSIPAGGGTVWTLPTVSGEIQADTISGLIVAYSPYGVLWPSLEPAEKTQPVLVTTDMITAKRVGNELGDIDPDELEKHAIGSGRYDWVNLPWNQFGTGKNGVGKRCKESRLLAILMEGDAFPYILHATPGSLKAMRLFVKKLPLPYYRCMCSFTLETTKNNAGQKFSRIVPELKATVDRETGAAIQALYTKPLLAALERITASVDIPETQEA